MSTEHDIVLESAVTIQLTAAQRGVYYAQQLDPDIPMSVAAFAEFRGDLDVDVMDQAVVTAAAETESGHLRVTRSAEGEPAVYLDYDRPVRLRRRDFSGSDDPRATALAWIDGHRGKPTDLEADPLLETYLLHLGPQHDIWYCWGHHLAFDGYAAMVMMVRVSQHYIALTEGTSAADVPIATMADIAQFDREYRGSAAFAADREYWTDRLVGSGEPVDVASLSPRSAAAAPIATVVAGDLDDALANKIRAVAADNHLRPASVITAAVSLYLAGITDRGQATLSLPVAARDRDVLRNSAGLTSNVAPLVLDVAGATAAGPSVAEVAAATNAEITNAEIKGAIAHQRFRHEDITGGVLSSPSGRRGFFGPMVSVMLFFEQIDFGSVHGDLNRWARTAANCRCRPD